MINIQRIERDGWVLGRVGDYRFEALVLAKPATNPEHELPSSRITRLIIRSGGEVVYRWHQGPSIEPPNEEVQDVVVLLTTQLESFMPCKPGDRIRLLCLHNDQSDEGDEDQEEDNIQPARGTLGTVVSLTRSGGWLHVFVDWDSGHDLALIDQLDSYELVPRENG